MVPVAGLEPARCYPLDFESSLSTISTHRQSAHKLYKNLSTFTMIYFYNKPLNKGKITDFFIFEKKV